MLTASLLSAVLAAKSGIDLVAAQLTFINGLNDNGWNKPDEARHWQTLLTEQM